jgi:glutamyl-tRNA reductase
MSVASTAVHALAEGVSLPSSRVVIVGAGDTAQKVGRHLRAVGVGSLVVANRTRARADALATTLRGEAIDLEAVPGELRRADAVVCAAAAPTFLVTARSLHDAMAARGARSLVIADLGMPGVVEPVSIPGLTLVGLEGLERAADQHRERRRAEVPRVVAVVERELSWLRSWARHQAAHPLVSGLRQKVEQIRRAELARVKQELRVDHAIDDGALDRLSRRLLDQVLAIPLAALHDEAVPLDPSHAEYLQRLFALDTETPCGR